MPAEPLESTERIYRLRESKKIEFDELGRLWASSPRFEKFVHGELGMSCEITRNWKYLREREPVSSKFASLFVMYLNRNTHLKSETLDSVFELITFDKDDDFWGESIGRIVDLMSQECPRDPRFIYTGEDAREAAEMILHSLGKKISAPGDPNDKPSCLSRASERVGTDIDGFASWIYKMVSPRYRRAATFIRIRQKREAFIMTLPLNAAAFDRFCAGKMGPLDFTPDDLTTRAEHLLPFAWTEFEGLPTRNAWKRSLKQAQVFFEQMAWLTRHMDPIDPEWVSVAVNDRMMNRFLRFGFVDTGNVSPTGGFPIVAFRRRSEFEASETAIMARNAFRTILAIYRNRNIKYWRMEDRLQ